MSVIVYMCPVCHAELEVMFVFYLHATFQVYNSNSSLSITKLEAKYSVFLVVMLFFIQQRNYVNKSCISF